MNDFKDISTERYRIYTFAGGDIVRIDNPINLAVSDSGGHRIVDGSGNSHYIPAKWIHLEFRVRDGAPHFSF